MLIKPQSEVPSLNCLFSFFCTTTQIFVSQKLLDHPRAGLMLAILVLGDDKVDIEEASKCV